MREIVEVFSGTTWEAELVKSLLESAGIRSFLRNNVLASYLYDPIGAEGVKVMILDTDYLEAREIVKGYFRSKRSEGDL